MPRVTKGHIIASRAIAQAQAERAARLAEIAPARPAPACEPYHNGECDCCGSGCTDAHEHYDCYSGRPCSTCREWAARPETEKPATFDPRYAK